MLQIQTVKKNDHTILKKDFSVSPFKVMNITEDLSEGVLHLMLMSSSPGVLDGDHYRMHWHLGEGSSLHVHTQSYQRLFQMKTGASQELEIRMDKNSTLFFLPHPSVPHKLSNFVARNRIRLSEGCRLVWGEVLTCGRKLSGEFFCYSKYQTITEIFLCEKLVVKENLLIEPGKLDPLSMGQMEGFTHQSSFIYMGEGAEKVDELIHSFLAGQSGMLYGVSSVPFKGIIVRMLANSAEYLFSCHQQMALLIKNAVKKHVKMQTDYGS